MQEDFSSELAEEESAYGETISRMLGQNGFPLARSRLDVARMSNASFGDQIEDKILVSKLKGTTSITKGNGTPMKTLIAQEMSKEVVSKLNPPNLVAKLMGLDTLPHQHSKSSAQRIVSKGYSRHSLSYSGRALECWETDDGFLDKQMKHQRHRCQELNDCKYVYEIWKQSEKMHKRDSSPCKERYNESAFEKKMALVHQKFTEAKHLATDEKGCQSKEFIDAVEVLSSNRDIFLKFLQESNSLFSHHLYSMQSTINPPPEAKCITVLRPSKIVESETLPGSAKKIEKQSDKPKLGHQDIAWDRNNSYTPAFDNHRVDVCPSQPTQIVVLKYTPGKTHDVKAVVSPPPSPPEVVRGEEILDKSESEEAQESRALTKEITRQMSERLMGHTRDETLLSSVFSNGYIGDESSFVKSENDYISGNLSDSEVMSPASRHLWDHSNKFGSPWSTSSLSFVSCSPESSVCREAKKRLSERWAMMKSNASSQEEKDFHRSSSTLGEMLALSDSKKLERTVKQAFHLEQEPKVSSSYLISNVEEDGIINSPKGLSRSKSLPVSSIAHGARINIEVLDPVAGKEEVAKELTKAKGTKSSFKGKVSSLFFSRNKKSSKERCAVSQSLCESQLPSPKIAAGSLETPCDKCTDDASLRVNNNGFEACSSSGLHASSNIGTNPDMTSDGTRQAAVPYEVVLSVTEAAMPGNTSGNQDQPSPISVLELLFDEDDNPLRERSGNNRPDCGGSEVVLKSNLIGKSPPIESIVRTFSWEYSHVESASWSPSPISSRPEEDGGDWPLLIQSLLTEAGLDANLRPSLFFARWHSPESPLDPVLRDKYSNIDGKELLHEGKRRKRHSYQKLVFDSVNETLLKSSSAGQDIISRTNSCSGSAQRFSEFAPEMLVDYMWAQMKEWFVSDVRWSSGECGDNSSLVVERVVKNEVVGKGWVDKMGVELDNVGKDIEGKLLEELVEETLVDLADTVS